MTNHNNPQRPRIDPLLKAELGPVLRQQRRTKLAARFAVWWSILAIAACALILIQPGSEVPSRIWIALFATLAVVGAIVIVKRQRRNEPDFQEIARQIEARQPELNGVLITAVQQRPGQNGRLNYLQERIVRQAFQHGRINPWTESLTWRIAGAHLGNVAAIALFLLVLTVFRPGAEIGRIIRNGWTADGVTITPGDTEIERGERLVVVAEFDGPLPPDVELIFSDGSDPVQRIPLVKSLSDPVFGGSVPEVTTNLVYHVEYAGKRTPDFKVSVFEYPRLEKADADLTYPEYTKLEPKRIENTRRISAVEGSQLAFQMQLNKPVVRAELIPQQPRETRSSVDAALAPARPVAQAFPVPPAPPVTHGDPYGGHPPADHAHAEIPPANETKPVPPARVALTVSSNQPLATLSSFSLETNRTYLLQLVDADGRTNKVKDRFVFDVLKNREPELKIAAPRGDTRPSALEEVTFEGTVWDDFGVQAYGLAYTVAGEETKFVELGDTVARNDKHPFKHVLRLEDLEVAPDQFISWYLWADDIGPDGQVRRSAGDLYFAEVRPFDEVFRQGQGGGQQQGGGGGGGGGQAAELAELQKQIITATWNLSRQQKPKQSAPKDEAPPEQEKKDRSDETSLLNKGARTPSSAVSIRVGFADEGIRAPVRQFFGQRAAEDAPRQRRREVDPETVRVRDNLSAVSATNKAASVSQYANDLGVVRDGVAQAIQLAQAAAERQSDGPSAALWNDLIKQLEQADAQLEKAAKSPALLSDALASQQAAFQTLLRLQQREFQVQMNRNRNQQGGGGSGQRQRQRQLDQLDLTQEENRYETERLAQSPQSPERREQLQVMNRLAELARRQQDLNERLRELQTALQEARTEQEREEIRRELKRLQEEEERMLADADELQQRMNRQENQSNMSEQRQQLEQTRQEMQQAAEAAQQGSVSQALASGTRAQRQLEQMREDMRRQNSSEFADDLRQLRADARDAERRQEEIRNQLDSLGSTEGPKTLDDSGERSQTLQQLAQQQQQLTNLLDRAAQLSEQTEQAEPLASRELYDTLRKFSQDDANNVREFQDELIQRGLVRTDLYQRLNQLAREDSAKSVELTSEMLRQGLLQQARQSGDRAQGAITHLREGIEQAVEKVLGDDTEELRYAQQQLENLAEQIEREIAQNTMTNRTGSAGLQSARADSSTNQLAQAASRQGQQQDGAQPSENGQQGAAQSQTGDQQQESGQQAGGGQQGQQSDQQQTSGQGEQQESGQQPGGGQQNQQSGQQQVSGQGGRQQGEPGQGDSQQQGNQGGGQAGDGDNEQVARNGRGNRDGQRDGNNGGGGLPQGLEQFLDRLGGDNNYSGGGSGGPVITGDDFVTWSDRLREVEELVDNTALQNQLATARERARLLRQDFRRNREKPDWAVLRLEVLNPLVEVRDEIGEELARRGSKDSLVPIDRDPVPSRYSELVRRYYEELGK